MERWGASTSLPADPPWLAVAFEYPNHIPTMISRVERHYLWWLAATVWTDAGHIVEMGPWLGGSTACLAEGARARAAAPRHRLFSIDNFVWRRFMSDRADLALRPGDSFEDEFKQNVASYEPFVVTDRKWLPDELVPGDRWADDVRGDGTRGDLFRWQDGPIEIAFVDGAKSWAGLAHFLDQIAPSLTTGALLVLQDYKYWGSYWVPMMCELLADRLELIHVLPVNTVTFRVTSPLALPLGGAVPDVQSGLTLLEQAARRLDRHGDRLGANVVRLSSVRFLAHRGRATAATNVLRRVAGDRPSSAPFSDIYAAHEWLEMYTCTEIPMIGLRARLRLRSVARRFSQVGTRRESRRSTESRPGARQPATQADE